MYLQKQFRVALFILCVTLPSIAVAGLGVKYGKTLSLPIQESKWTEKDKLFNRASQNVQAAKEEINKTQADAHKNDKEKLVKKLEACKSLGIDHAKKSNEDLKSKNGTHTPKEISESCDNECSRYCKDGQFGRTMGQYADVAGRYCKSACELEMFSIADAVAVPGAEMRQVEQTTVAPELESAQ